MNEDERQERHNAISRAAYALLTEHGYAGASMLRIARAAKASNETLYRWYGNKDGLFRAMVEDNAAETRRLLEMVLEGQDDPCATLERKAPVLLAMLLGDKTVLLNRAAAVALDPDPASGRSKKDAADAREILRIHEMSKGRYGTRKIWRHLRREDWDIARCTVERLMKAPGLQGVTRGKKKTTIPDPAMPFLGRNRNRRQRRNPLSAPNGTISHSRTESSILSGMILFLLEE